MVCTFLMPLIWGRDVMNALGKVIAQQLRSFTIVLNKMMHNRKDLFAALL